MFIWIFIAVLAMALITTLIWAVGEVRIPMFALSSAFLWALLAFEGGEITRQQGLCCKVTTEVPGVQLFAGLMTFASIAALILYRFGEFPPTRESTDRATET